MEPGDRLCVDGHLATLRFVGSIPQWPNTTALGLEWDERGRGKGNGSLNGVTYFHSQGAALFIKASNPKIQKRVSFAEALHTRYAGSENEKALDEEIVMGKKHVERLGFDKLNRLTRDFVHLKTISLDKLGIFCAGEKRELQETRHLDLSYNLFVDWAEVVKILHCAPLESLNLNGNRFVAFPSVMPNSGQSATVTELSLASTQLGHHLKDVLVHFPNLQHLCLASNFITDEMVDSAQFPESLQTLDVSHNDLTRLPNLPLRTLLAAFNAITSFSKETSSVSELDIRGNPISSWHEIDRICDVFPNLRSIRLDQCALFNGFSDDEMTLQSIARLGCTRMESINGSSIKESDVTNAELYFISQVKAGSLQYHNPRQWARLLSKHDISEAPAPAPVSSHRLLLHICDGDRTILSRPFMVDCTILRLKGTIAKLRGTSVLDFALYYYVNDDVAYLDNNFATLESAGLKHNQTLHVLSCSRRDSTTRPPNDATTQSLRPCSSP